MDTKSQLKESNQRSRAGRYFGFTLIEVLIAVGIIAVLSTVGIGYYRNVVKSNEVTLTAKSIASALQTARSKAMAAENNMKWGVHFVNDPNGDYYEIFYTPTDYNDPAKIIAETVYLPGGLDFNNVAATSDVIFDKITGNTSNPTNIAVASEDKIASVDVTQIGNLNVNVGAKTGDTPSAPTGLIATPGLGQVSLSWTAPAAQGSGAINGYYIHRCLISNCTNAVVLGTGTATAYVDTGLTGGTTYYYKVSAINPYGQGLKSSEASATPTSAAPAAPTGLTATPGTAQITLNWVAANPNGSPVTNYKVYRGTSPGGEVFLTQIGNVLTHTDTGLTNGTTYYYKVSAVNAVGEGALSSEASATPALVPGAPTGLTATAANQQVSLSWTAPASDGGSAITNYKIYRGTSSGVVSPLATIGNLTTYTATNLVNGTTYYFKVSAINAIGEGPQSTEASATPQGVAPGAPTGLTATGSTGQIALSWTAPASDGGLAISSYKIYRGTATNAESFLAQDDSTPGYNDTSVSSGVTYYYKVSAVNAKGEGPLSNEASAVTGPSVTISATAGSQAVTLNSGSAYQLANTLTCSGAASCAAFTLTLSSGTETITSIKLTETGTASAASDLSNFALFYDTDGNFSNGVTGQYGSGVATATGETVTFTNSLGISPGATYYFYIAFDLRSPLSTSQTFPKGGQTVDWQIAANGDVTVSGSSTVSGGGASLAGNIVVLPEADALAGMTGGTDGRVADNWTAGDDELDAIASDSQYVYLAGYENGGTAAHVQKRSKATGALVTAFDTDGRVSDDITAAADVFIDAEVDSQYVYLAGYENGGAAFHVQKRDKTTGALVTSFGTSGRVADNWTAGNDVFFAMAMDAQYLYLGGYENSGPSFHVQKRDKTTGALVSAFDGDGRVTDNFTAGNDVVRHIEVDSQYVYLAGYENGGAAFHVQKRDKTTGALVTAFDTDGRVTDAWTAGNDVFYAMASDSQYLYMAGSENGAAAFHIQKRDKTTGALVTAFDTDGRVTDAWTAGTDEFQTIAVDSQYVYAAGYENGNTNAAFHVQKRDKTTGALVTAFDTDGRVSENLTAGNDLFLDSSLNSQYIYLAGYDNTITEYYVQKRKLSDGSLTATFGGSVYAGDPVTIGGYGFGAPTAGANRQDCTTATVDRGCVKFTLGATATVANSDISAWTNSAITFTTTAGLIAASGTDAVEVRAANQADATKLSLTVAEAPPSGGRATFYLQQDDTEAVSAYNTMTLSYPTFAGTDTANSTDTAVAFATPCEGTGITSAITQIRVDMDAITGDKCIATFFSPVLGQSNVISTSQTDSIHVQFSAGRPSAGNNGTVIPTARFYKYDGTYTLFATLTGTALGATVVAQTVTGTPSANVTLNPTDRIAVIYSGNITVGDSSSQVDYFQFQLNNGSLPYINFETVGVYTANRPDLTGSKDDDFTTYAGETNCTNAGVAYNTKWTCTTPSGASLGKFKAHYTTTPGVTDVGHWLVMEDTEDGTLGTNFGASPENTYIYQTVDTNANGDGNVTTVVNAATRTNSSGGNPQHHAGLLLWASDTDYLEVQVNFDNGTQSHVVQINNNGTLSSPATLSSNLVWLRWNKVATSYQAQYSMDGSSWTNLGSAISHGTTFTRGGLTVYTSQTNGHAGGAFEYFDYDLANTPKTLTIGTTAGSQASVLSSGHTGQFANTTGCTAAANCAAFTLSIDTGGDVVTSIKLTDVGTASLADFSNFALYYDTDGNFSNGVTGQYGTGVAAATGETVTFTNSVTITAGTTYYFYVAFDVRSQLSASPTYPKGGQTVNFRIAANGDVTAAGVLTTVTGAPATLAGVTTVRPEADAILGITSGSDGLVITDPTAVASGDERVRDTASDETAIYLIGDKYLGGECTVGSWCWRIEKRDKTTGALVTAFDTDGIVNVDPTNGDDEPYAVAVDEAYLYVTGFQASGGPLGLVTWRIEKRDKTTGALVSAFDGDGVVLSDPTTGSDRARSITLDANYLYIGGDQATGGGCTTGGTCMRVEKRDKTTGALVSAFDGDGVVLSDPTTANDIVLGIAVDSTAVYFGGQQAAGAGCGTLCWRVEKLDKATGALVTAFDGDGVAQSDPTAGNDVLYELIVDDTYFYGAGYDSGAAQWRIEKRDKITGALCSAAACGTQFGTNGVVTSNPAASTDVALDLDQDATSIYIVGNQVGGTCAVGLFCWRTEKRDKTTGNLVSGFGTGGAVTLDLVTGDEEANAVTLDSGYLYIGGYMANGNPYCTALAGNSCWRVEKRKISDGSNVSTFGDIVSAGSSVTVSGYGFGTPTAGANRQDCTTATVDRGCVKFIVGGTATVSNTDISSWTNTAIAFTASDSLGSTGGTDAVETRAANQADATPLTLNIVVTFGTGGVITGAPTVTYDARAMAKDSTYLYVVGSGWSPLDSRIEKRLLTTGALDTGFGTSGVIQGDTASSSNQDIEIDGTYMYVVGTEQNFDWRFEKRLLTTGALDTGFGTNGLITDVDGYRANTIAIDSTYMYVGGETAGADWRIQKRLLTTGALDTNFGTSGTLTVAAGYAVRDMVIDGTYMYLVGDDDTVNWRIEKRFLTTGAVDNGFGTSGAITVTAGQLAYGTAKDSTYLYIVGYDSGTNWRIEKRLLTTGAVDSGFGTSGVITGDAASNYAYAVAVDSTYMYVAGENSTPDWRIEKRLLTTGALDSNFGTSGVVTSAANSRVLLDVIINGSFMYLSGYETTNVWRIERRMLSNGALQ